MVKLPVAVNVRVAPTPLVPLLYVYDGKLVVDAYTTDALGSRPCATLSTYAFVAAS